MKDYEKALTAYEKALEEVEKHFGRNLSYAVLCENCAAVCEALQKEDPRPARRASMPFPATPAPSDNRKL